MITIPTFQEAEWSFVWTILKPVFRVGETYAFDQKITESEALTVWIELPKATYVTLDESESILGTY